VLAVIAAHSAGASAADTEHSMFSFNAFGTIGIVHSNEDQADFVGSVFQPDGAGYSHAWDIGPDTKLAGQVQAKFSDRFSAILQVVAQHQYDDTYTPGVEWANLKFAVTDNLDIRAGRVVLPGFMVSETRLVGYANPWIRPPQEVYSINSITSSDGGDITYRAKLGRAQNTLSGFYGNSEAKLDSGVVKATPVWGINDTVVLGDLTLRAGYVSLLIDIELKGSTLDPLYSGLTGLGNALNSFGFTTQGAQALALVEKYKLTDIALKSTTLSASYDPGNWFVMAEGTLYKGTRFFSDSKAGYVTGGYRIAKFTPYVTVSSIKTDVKNEPGISTTGLPGGFAAGATALNAGLNTSKENFAATQRSASIGLRWDFMGSADLKVQYDRLSVGDNSSGRFGNTQPGFVTGGDADIVSIAVDFVY
jgi:hypothetical protein